jgi:predicted ATPase
MLKRLRIKNFRSIQNTEMSFAPSGLTVLIGANGSGKSNIIRSLDFVGTVARDGLAAALNTQRTREALLPKALSRRELRDAQTILEYEFEFPNPTWYPNNEPPLSVRHRLALGPSAGVHMARLATESLQFGNPLVAQYYFDKEQRRRSPELPPAFRESSFALVRTDVGSITFRATPSIDEFPELFLGWLGLQFLATAPRDESTPSIEMQLQQLLARLDESGRPTTNATAESPTEVSRFRDSFLTSKYGGALSLCSEATAFRENIAAIKRYDLQLVELRREQDVRTDDTMTSDGGGLPSAMRQLRANDDKSSWQRLTSTLHAIAPHIVNASVSKLRNGKEFVKFLEERLDRPVESWESSDGTLRALAILLALEDPSAGVILIEEPEIGLHPWAVRILISHMRAVVSERNLQVVLTTHSPHVLESVEPDEVVLVTRDESGTVIRSLREAAPLAKLEMGEVGRLWVSGLLGAVPGAE